MGYAISWKRVYRKSNKKKVGHGKTFLKNSF